MSDPSVSRSSLRAYLAVMILIATVPLALLSFILVMHERDSAQAQLEESLRSMARGNALLVSREMTSTIEALALLGRSPEFTNRQWPALHERLRQLLQIVPNWHSLYVTDTQGHLLMSTLVPPGKALPALEQVPSVRQQSGQPIVRSLQVEPLMGEHLTGIQVPIWVDGEVTYFLGAWISPVQWQRVLQNTGVPSDGFVSLFDSDRRVIARSKEASRYAGQLLAPSMRREIDQSLTGLQQGDLFDGSQAYIAWQQTSLGGWGVQVGMPTEPVVRARIQSLTAAAVGGALSLVAGMLMAWLIGRRVTVPLRQLASAGAAGITGPIPITEIAQLRDALKSLEAERHSATDRLRATADELQLIFSTTPVGLAIAQDRDSRSVLRNTALMGMLAATPEAPEGTATVVQDGRPLSLQEQPLQRCAQQGVAVDNVELTVIHANGQTLKVLAHALPLTDANGQLRGAIAGFVDISQRVEAQNRIVRAEQRLRESRQMVELAQQAGKVGFFDHHVGNHTVHGTAGLAQLLGMPSQAFELDWSQWLRCIDPRDIDQVRDVIDAGWRSQSTEIRFEFRSRERDENPRWFASRCALMFGEGGEPAHLIGVVLDITEQKFAERDRAEFLAEQQKARLVAENANRAKDEFLAMLGHELRNPLGAISSAAEVMSRSPTPELADRARIIIQRQTRHLARLMEDLLDVTRVISGKINLLRQPHDLKRCVENVVSNLQIANQLHLHTLALDLQSAWVLVDTTRTEQMVSNLLTNAVKYTPQGGTIRIKTWQEDDAGVLEVSDDGVGMSETLVGVVFDLFVQGERNLDRRQGGMGVGLTLVRRLAELHGGAATAHSEGPMKGSCFTVRLPRSEEGATAPARLSRPHQIHRSIVVVEDNADALEALRTILEIDGYQVETAEDGAAGLELILRSRPDVALVDIGLPGLNGLEVAQRVRQAGLTLRMVAVSGYGQAADVEQALAAGFDSHVIKPIDPMILAQRLQ